MLRILWLSPLMILGALLGVYFGAPTVARAQATGYFTVGYHSLELLPDADRAFPLTDGPAPPRPRFGPRFIPRVPPIAAAAQAHLHAALPVYRQVAEANIRTVHGRRAPVPAPIYANGIYVRDAFYTIMGLADMDLLEESFRWFEERQDPVSGQIPTAVAFDPADDSLVPQDDESGLLYLIWAALLYRDGRDVDLDVLAQTWEFVRSRVVNDAYWSPPGRFRYWADCWQPAEPDVISYNQGYYALAARLLWEIEQAHEGEPLFVGLDEDAVWAAAQVYRTLYRDDLGFLPLSGWNAGRDFQDVSALLPEFFHRYLTGEGMMPDLWVLATVDHHLQTAAVLADDGAHLGIKNIAQADGDFVDPGYFDCPTLRARGNYHNGGYWPMYTLVELALAASIAPHPRFVEPIVELVLRETASGTAHEYWELIPGHEGTVQPTRSDYAWNVLIVPALRWAGLAE